MQGEGDCFLGGGKGSHV